MIQNFLGLYAAIAVLTLVLLAHVAGKNAKALDLWVGAFAWPYTAFKFVEHLIKY